VAPVLSSVSSTPSEIRETRRPAPTGLHFTHSPHAPNGPPAMARQMPQVFGHLIPGQPLAHIPKPVAQYSPGISEGQTAFQPLVPGPIQEQDPKGKRKAITPSPKPIKRQRSNVKPGFINNSEESQAEADDQCKDPLWTFGGERAEAGPPRQIKTAVSRKNRKEVTPDLQANRAQNQNELNMTKGPGYPPMPQSLGWSTNVPPQSAERVPMNTAYHADHNTAYGSFSTFSTQKVQHQQSHRIRRNGSRSVQGSPDRQRFIRNDLSLDTSGPCGPVNHQERQNSRMMPAEVRGAPDHSNSQNSDYNIDPALESIGAHSFTRYSHMSPTHPRADLDYRNLANIDSQSVEHPMQSNLSGFANPTGGDYSEQPMNGEISAEMGTGQGNLQVPSKPSTPGPCTSTPSDGIGLRSNWKEEI
jgi:hypothetical protein